MVWWHAETAEQLQAAYNRFRRTGLGGHLGPVWSVMALHRPAEFNKSHVPAFLAEEESRKYVCVYPFVRSYEWYLLPDAERRGAAGRARPAGAGVPGRPGQHGGLVRAQRLRVDPGLRGRRAAPDRRPDAAPAQLGDPPARPRGGAVLHRHPALGGRARRRRCPSLELAQCDADCLRSTRRSSAAAAHCGGRNDQLNLRPSTQQTRRSTFGAFWPALRSGPDCQVSLLAEGKLVRRATTPVRPVMPAWLEATGGPWP